MASDILPLLNPWWAGRESPVIQDWREREIRWRPDWLDQISLKPFSLNILIGPRLVGKTTGIHLLIDELMRVRRVRPEAILYLNLDLSPDQSSLRAMLEEYHSFRKSSGVRTSYLFLDEVTSLKGWWKVIKGYVDAGFFSRDVLVVTGSSSLRLRGEVELFPGRMGEGREVHVWPLSFREFLRVRGVEVRTTGDLRGDMARLLPRSMEIRELFLEYLEVGGFPLSVNRDHRAVEYAVRSLEGEILRAGRDPQLARGVLSSILRKAPSPASYASIGSDLSVSHRTVRDYVELLRGLMALDTAMLRRGGRVMWRKERKFFLLDPFTARAASIWTNTGFLKGALYEWVVQAHLLRRFGEVFYERNSREIDAIAGDLRVEVKAGKPHRRYPRGVTVLDEGNIHLFLAAVA